MLFGHTDTSDKPPSHRIMMHCHLSIFFQSKLRRMTTGGAPGFMSAGGVVLDRQGVVNTQHRPSAKSEKARIGEVKHC